MDVGLEETSVEGVLVEDVSVEGVLVEDVSVEGVLVEDVSVEGVLVENMSVEGVLVEDVSVEGVLVEDGAQVNGIQVGVVTSEVLLSEKQVKALYDPSVMNKCKLTNDKLKDLQWLGCWTTTLPQCITTLCILSCG